MITVNRKKEEMIEKKKIAEKGEQKASRVPTDVPRTLDTPLMWFPRHWLALMPLSAAREYKLRPDFMPGRSRKKIRMRCGIPAVS